MYNLVNAKPGDTVVCINSGGSYTTYNSFFIHYGLKELLSDYNHGPLIIGREYTVLYRFKHTSFANYVFVLRDKYTGYVYLCTDSRDYLYSISNTHRQWTERSKIRVFKVMEPYHLEYRFIDGGYLFVHDRVYSNVPRMSSDRLRTLVSSIENEAYYWQRE